ncbi:MAG: hypothetical protein IKS17_08970 [Firmicutes bacterium]|nr:hypothetical protein [Bacillota bacterium]
MFSRHNGVLAGIFFILAGILFLLRNVLPISFGTMIVTIAGIELLIAHFYSKSLLALILGSYFTYWGVLHIVELDTMLYSALAASAIFFIPAIIFLILYLTQKKRTQLTWLCLFLLLGTDLLINRLTGIDAIGTLLICVGIALVLDYLLGGTYAFTSRLQLGVFLIIIGILKMADWRTYLFAYVLPAALIWVGIILLIKAAVKGGGK